MAKNRKKKLDSNGEGKTWTWRNGKVNIGDGWTLLSVECFLNKSCKHCLYYRYCKQTKNSTFKIPILKRVIKGLFAKYGFPPQQLVDRAHNINYYD